MAFKIDEAFVRGEFVCIVVVIVLYGMVVRNITLTLGCLFLPVAKVWNEQQYTMTRIKTENVIIDSRHGCLR